MTTDEVAQPTDEQISEICLEVNMAHDRVVVRPEQVTAMVAEQPLDEPLDQEVMEAVFSAMSKRGF